MTELDRTSAPAYDTAMEHIEAGRMAACVPVVNDGEFGIWTTGGELADTVKLDDDLDVLALAIVAIRHAYREADKAGAHAVL